MSPETAVGVGSAAGDGRQTTTSGGLKLGLWLAIPPPHAVVPVARRPSLVAGSPSLHALHRHVIPHLDVKVVVHANPGLATEVDVLPRERVHHLAIHGEADGIQS